MSLGSYLKNNRPRSILLTIFFVFACLVFVVGAVCIFTIVQMMGTPDNPREPVSQSAPSAVSGETVSSAYQSGDGSDSQGVILTQSQLEQANANIRSRNNSLSYYPSYDDDDYTTSYHYTTSGSQWYGDDDEEDYTSHTTSYTQSTTSREEEELTSTPEEPTTSSRPDTSTPSQPTVSEPDEPTSTPEEPTTSSQPSTSTPTLPEGTEEETVVE